MAVESQEHLIDMIEQGNEKALRTMLSDMASADIAEYIDEHFEVYNALALLEKMTPEQQADVFGYLRPNNQQELATHMEIGLLAKLFRDMSSDERADVYAMLDLKLQDALMRRMAKREREDMLRLASYEEGSVGAVMTSDYAAIPMGGTVETALRRLRQSAPEKETIYQAYVVDSDHKLHGVVSLRDLITASPDDPIDDIMVKDVVTLTPDMPQAEAARIISRYDFIAIPIISHDNILVGMVTFDDAMDVVEEEDTDTMHKSATVGKIDGGLKDASPILLYRRRINWLVLLVFANIFSGAGIAYFEATIQAYGALLFFLPLLIASGGNTGAQAATLMVRGIATGEIARTDWFRMLFKELTVSIGLGVTMAVAIMVVGWWRAGPEIILVVAISMFCIVLVGSLIGVLLPFVLNRLGWDPATASTPLVTTIADTSGVLIYFGFATTILNITPT
ncbi:MULTISPECIES: magnesium transporter [Gammaproteobacteria]|uniref:magnesium transporter n=1 Tax=Gammaproteobacteria TaxID=1236 RepID=UPI000DCF9FE0|nr:MULTISPECIES: magnesium transporter [Gammaproteobacteria]RTE86758.1 magnesium transporter [Aliidiomarina sp. B3213]TCZ90688.1 magnesium transporter [Lysobacter sp. N42]